MNRFRLATLAAFTVAASLVAKADTVINLNATIPQNSYGNYANNLASGFYTTTTFGPGTYVVNVIGAGVTGSNGVTSVYSGWNFAASCVNGTCSPAPGDYTEKVSYSTNGSGFSNASASNGYQNSYVAGTTDQLLFAGNYASTAAALAANTNSPYTFTLATATAVTFYLPDGSYLPTGNNYGFDDNYGGVSLDVKAVTPEPSSLLLLATGALSAAGAIRRKMTA